MHSLKHISNRLLNPQIMSGLRNKRTIYLKLDFERDSRKLV